MDAVLLARLQFALTIGFHFLFPPITIGLAWLLVVVETLGWRKRDEVYARIGAFFAKLLGLTFAVGVATGIVMEFQFGTNWARVLQVRRRHLRRPAGGRGRLRLLPGIRLPRALPLRPQPRLQGRALVLHPHGRRRRDHFGLLDHRREFLAADAGRLRRAQRPRGTDKLLGGGLQPVDGHPLSPHRRCGADRGAFFMAGIAAYYLLKKREIEFAQRPCVLR